MLVLHVSDNTNTTTSPTRPPVIVGPRSPTYNTLSGGEL